jgi:hypothetical protein
MSLESIIDTQNTICLESELVDRTYSLMSATQSPDKSLSKWQKDPTIRAELESSLIKGAYGMYAYTPISFQVLY